MPQNYAPVNNKKGTYAACRTADLESAAEAVKRGHIVPQSLQKLWHEEIDVLMILMISSEGVKSAGRPTLLSAD